MSQVFSPALDDWCSSREVRHPALESLARNRIKAALTPAPLDPAPPARAANDEAREDQTRSARRPSRKMDKVAQPQTAFFFYRVGLRLRAHGKHAKQRIGASGQSVKDRRGQLIHQYRRRVVQLLPELYEQAGRGGLPLHDQRVVVISACFVTRHSGQRHAAKQRDDSGPLGGRTQFVSGVFRRAQIDNTNTLLALWERQIKSHSRLSKGSARVPATHPEKNIFRHVSAPHPSAT